MHVPYLMYHYTIIFYIVSFYDVSFYDVSFTLSFFIPYLNSMSEVIVGWSLFWNNGQIK